MKSRNLLAGTAAAALTIGACVGSALADPIDLGGYSGPITIKFSDFESFTGTGAPVTGNSNYGIFQITSILDKNQNIIYSAPVGTPTTSDPLLVGVFSGIMVTGTSGTPPTEHTFNSGGVFSLYDDTTQSFGNIGLQGTGGYGAAGCAVNTQCYNGITNKGYDNILNLSLVVGANSAAPTSTLYGTINVSTPLSGTAQGYADITSGSDAGEFARGTQTTGIGTKADFFFNDGFCASSTSHCSGPIADWQLGSNDPIHAAIAAPEPASLALLGAGLLGLGGAMRRRRRKA